KTLVATALTDNPSLQLSIRLDSIRQDTAFVHYAVSSSDKNYFLKLVVTESKLVSKIGRGENSGKTLSHDGVVRVYSSTDLREKNGQVKMALKKFTANPNCELIGFVQHKQSMKILAAASAHL